MNASKSQSAASHSVNGAPQKRRKKLNYWVLTISLLVVFVVAPGLYSWHYIQTRRLASALLEQAAQFSDQGKPREAAECLQRYLKIRPDDGEVRVQLAETYDRSANDFAGKDRAVQFYYQALGWAPAEKAAALRLRVVNLLLETGQYVTAEQEVAPLLDQQRNSETNNSQDKPAENLQAKAERLRALAIYGQCLSGSWKKSARENRSVAQIVADALESNPGDRDLLLTLVEIYRLRPQWLSEKEQSLTAEERNQAADRLVEALVQAHPKDAESLLIFYQYKRRFQLPEAQENLERALQLEPRNPRVLFSKAETEQVAAWKIYRDAGRQEEAKRLFDSAKKYYREILELKPAELSAVLNGVEIRNQAYARLGTIQLQLEGVDAALRTWNEGIGKDPRNVSLNMLVAETLLDRNRPEEAARRDVKQGKEGPLEILESMLGRLNSSAKQNQLRESPEVKALQQSVRLFRGRWYYLQGDYSAAAPLLGQVAQGDRTSERGIFEAVQANLIMGEIYSRWGQVDQAANVYETAATLTPRAVQPHLSAAKAWESIGRSDAAEKHLRQAIELQNTPMNQLLLAQTLFRRQLQNPPSQRRWDDFDKAFQAARDGKPDADPVFAWQRDLLEFQAKFIRRFAETDLAAAGKESLPQVKKLEENHAETPTCLTTLAGLYEALQAPSDADRLAEKLLKLKPREADSYLLQARLAMHRGQFDRAQAALEKGIRQVSAEQQNSLRRETIKNLLARNQQPKAAEQLRNLLKNGESSKKSSTDTETLNLIVTLAEQASGKDAQEAKYWEDELVRLEGPDGSLWRYCRARRLLAAAKDVQDPRFAEVERLQAEVKKMRPTWAASFLLEAFIQQQRGKLDEAVDAYQNAIKLGLRQLPVYENLVALLNRLKRYAEAERCLAAMKEPPASSLSLTSFEITRAAERGQWDQAIEVARRAAQAQPREARAALWLCRLLELDNQLDAAEKNLQQASQRWPTDAAVHYQLLKFYVRNGRSDQAREYLGKLEKNTEMPAADRSQILAQGYELVHDSALARQTWQKIAAQTPETAQAQTALASQLFSRDAEAAEKALRRALQIEPGYNPARRLLARLLADRGGEAEWNEASKLLSVDLSNPQEERMYRFLRALLLAHRGGKANLAEARAIVEKLVADPAQFTPQEVFLLARLYELEGNSEAAGQRLASLVEESISPASGYVAAYADFLLRQELPSDNDLRLQLQAKRARWVRQLQDLAPDSPQTATLVARWLQLNDRGKEVEPFLEGWVEKQIKTLPKNPQDEAKLAEIVGGIYFSLENYSAAERWYRRAVGLVPDRYPLLAKTLAGQGRFEEGIALCEKAAEKDASPAPSLAVAALLLQGQPKEKDLAQAEPLLSKAAATYHNRSDVLNMLAAVKILEGRLDNAAELYRQVLKLQPRDVVAMNNLATVLAEQPDHREEGKQLIDRAIAMAGPQAGLLDVKAVILILQGKPKEAVPLLEEAAAYSQADPRYCFHLAVAYQQAGDLEKARAAMKRANAMNLNRQILTPSDKKFLADLDRLLRTTDQGL